MMNKYSLLSQLINGTNSLFQLIMQMGDIHTTEKVKLIVFPIVYVVNTWQ